MSGKRYEFTKKTKQEALRRSGGICEAVGAVYGLPPGVRCETSLGMGFEADHYPLPAHVEGSNTVENCMAVCPPHHKHKTRTFDIPVEAKLKRVARKAGPVELRRRTKPIPSKASWPKAPKQKWPSRPWPKKS